MKRLGPPFVVVSALGCAQAAEPAPIPSGSGAAPPPTTSVAGPGPSGPTRTKSGLPSWRDVESGHQGTNPPHPVLIVDAAGYCYKKFEGGMIAPGPNRVEAICDKEHPCGTQIDCPKGASALSRGGKAEIPEKEAVSVAEAHLEKKGGKPGTTPKARLVESSKIWVVEWDAVPKVEVIVDAISATVVR